MIARLRQAGLLWATLMTVVALGILVGLGTWQLNRKVWKDKLVADINARLAAAPKPVAAAALFAERDGQLPVYMRVAIEGRFLHDRERFLFADGREGSGFHVLTPLEAERDRVIWVNRGYVPARLKDAKLRADGQPSGVVKVVGLVREQGERNQFTPENDVAGNVWYWRDLQGLTRSAKLADSVRVSNLALEAELEPQNPGGWPRGGTTLVKLPNRHLEYAGTWYGLALTLVGVFVAYARGRLRAMRG